MKINLTKRLGWLATAVVLSGAGLVATATGASAQPTTASTPSAATVAAAPLLFDINGSWTDVGSAKPVITAANGFLIVDMSYAHRPTATGLVINSSTISVTFPDAGTFTATLQAPNIIRWSNGSTWEKVFTGPTVVNLNGQRWTPGAAFSQQANGFLTVDMSDSHRPTATGFVIDSSTISVTFPDAGTFTATLQAPDTIRWSNGTTWQSLPLQ
jgi:hypothetical protein